ncbi:MAG: 30S ribosomal protein S12 methylthiotransferase RimO [Clostridiaceae bacterium]|nr:30S ribosomal protein S12 methylthiotransferase RimO [Clostridiaceae bacterium]
MNQSFYLLSLGCPKNEVDSECMSALLKEAGFSFNSDPRSARFLIINTCAFIEPAVEEAIEAILDLAEQKGGDSFLIVTGCLPQRYRDEILFEFPEVDAILGTGEYGAIVDTLKGLARGDDLRLHYPGPPGDVSYLDINRVPSAHAGTYAYLKIAEGCSNACSYCTIPRLRGPQRSRQPRTILNEARHLAKQGVRELILVAQDTTRYGMDLKERPTLAALLKQLTKELPDVELIRCLYFYADAVTDELIEEMASNPKLAPYVDLPIQHASNSILARMRRRETIEEITQTIEKFRQRIPRIVIRSTVITGFPGEGEEEFLQLLEYVRKIRFDRLGCFVFSPEDGTPAARMQDQVSRATAASRAAIIMETQKEIALEANKKRIGQVTRVLFEGVDARGILFHGRSFGEAPDIDPIIFVAATSPDLVIGSRPAVRIVDARPYELVGVSLNEYCK